MARPGVRLWGVEWDAAACATARAAGHHRIQGDVTKLRHILDLIVLTYLHASPPCQGFSLSGSGKGRMDGDRLIEAIASLWSDGHFFPTEHAVQKAMDDFDLLANDHRSVLTLEPLWWIAYGQPEFITFEQVPSVLPIWEAYAQVLRSWGYSVWTGVLHAEQYGVPQTRKRAILMARRGDHDVQPPAPTHSRYHSRDRARLDPGVLPWVSMAEALGWDDEDLVGFPRKDDGRDAVVIDGQAYRARDLRSAGAPAQVVTEKARSWTRFSGQFRARGAGAGERPDRSLEDPSFTVTGVDGGHTGLHWRVNNQSGTDFDYDALAAVPATVVQGRDIVPFRGTTANARNGSTKSRNDGFRVLPHEAGVLQGFPVDYPWTGRATKQHEQIGNAVPPPLAAAVVRALIP